MALQMKEKEQEKAKHGAEEDGWGQIKAALMEGEMGASEWMTETQVMSQTQEQHKERAENRERVCTAGGERDPKGEEIANRWNVPYDEVIGYYCQGLDFHEINRMYKLNRKTGMSSQMIFEKLQAGVSWEKIMEQSQPSSSQGMPQTGSNKPSQSSGMGNSKKTEINTFFDWKEPV